MAIADYCRGKVLKGHRIPYGTFTMDEQDSAVKAAYYGYGYRNDEDLPPLPCIEPDGQEVDPEEVVWKEERRRAIANLLDELTPRESKVLRMRFGIDMDRDMTLEEVGNVFDVSRERIRQIEAKALRKLKHPNRKLYDTVFPEKAQQQEIKDRVKLRKRMFEIEMMQMGWAWYQRHLNEGVNPDRHYKANSWIEHIRLTDPKLHRLISNEVNRYLDDIFTNRLRAPHDDGRTQAQGRP